MDIVRFDPDKDLTSLEYYLRNSYLEERRARSWLPARLHDVIYRVGAQEMDEGRERSADYMFLWKTEISLRVSFWMAKTYISASRQGVSICFLP